MRKILPAILFLLLFLLANPAFAAEKIDSFDVTVKINEDSSIDVSERIEYNFGDLQRHGIFRNIPIKYKARGGNFNLRLSDISVKDENGYPYNFVKSKEGQDIQIKIGDANKFVTGRKIYVINYKVNRAINYFDSWDELYWNMIGNEWPVSIEKVSAKVILPREIPENELKLACYSGYHGSNFSCREINANSQEVLFSEGFLLSGQGLTSVVGIPKGIINKPSIFQNLSYIIFDNWVLFIPILVFLGMLCLWWKKGKDPKGRGIIVAQYEAPNNLSPAEIGVIMDGDADNIDISSEIVHLAVKGYLKITKVKEGLVFKSDDYLLEKIKDENDLTDEFQKKLMNSLFAGDSVKSRTVKLSNLKNKFHKNLKDIKDRLCEGVKNKGYFAANPEDIQNLFAGIGATVAIVSFFLGSFGGLFLLSFLISGLIIIFFSNAMPMKTKRGSEAKELILGLKEYLSVAEEDRIKFHNAPEKNPERFEKLLPYAMVLKVEKEWAEQFRDIYEDKQPNWYADATGTHFNSIVLADNLSKFSSETGSSLSSTPSSASSGGSGFSSGGSGGGGGGGGGGSW